MSAAGEACDVEYSLAEEKDLQQVLDICSCDDYNGLDYMAAFFHRWLQEPGRLVFIARMNNRVVALESTLLVDGGRTVVLQGFRVVADLRGSGIAPALKRHVTGYVRHHYPEVSAFRLSRGDQPSPRQLAMYRVIAKEAILSLCCEAAHLGLFIAELRSRLSRQADASTGGPVVLTQQQAETLILSDHVVSNLLPGKTIIDDWEPLRPVEANLEVLRRRGPMWMADRVLEPTVVSLCSPPYAVPYRHALRINVNVFGHSLALVCAVFLAQLEALLPSLRGYLVLCVFVDPAVWSGLRQFCQNKANVSFFRDYWEEIVLETDV
ncbi:putative N-acetyltransferase 16-like [Scophthalmus maximus]|uniref:Putative N-acetyltransferase 16-like n=1 Tax=Scophthalmus maximus TaxID=52904 RepID=A0A2U9CJG8_SCOMX|nr:putative N-acetyltransferase 16-like [Scophthalmus maximus]